MYYVIDVWQIFSRASFHTPVLALACNVGERLPLRLLPPTSPCNSSWNPLTFARLVCLFIYISACLSCCFFYCVFYIHIFSEKWFYLEIALLLCPSVIPFLFPISKLLKQYFFLHHSYSSSTYWPLMSHTYTPSLTIYIRIGKRDLPQAAISQVDLITANYPPWFSVWLFVRRMKGEKSVDQNG